MSDPDTLVDSRPTVRTALDVGSEALRDAGIGSATVDAEWLLADVLSIPRGALRGETRRELDRRDAARYVLALRRRMKREPLQHIVGSQAFRQVTLKVSPDVMVPRPETEILAGWALELLPRGPRPPLVIDLGTGSGCVACALASERADVAVIAVDASPRAAALARANVAALGLAERVGVAVSDLFSALGPVRADVVVSNPPYLPTGLIPTLDPEVSQYDPRLALDGGPDGLDVIRRIVVEAPERLVPGGALVLETAGAAQARATGALMGDRGLVGIETRHDLAGVERFVAGRRR